MSARANNWSLTMNMKNIPRERCEEYIGHARQLGWNVEGQIEQGEEGTHHYQLLVKTPQVRFSAIKKVFPTAHIEVARNVAALRNYVHKEDTRVEEIKQVENKFVSWKDVRDRFFEWIVDMGYSHLNRDDERMYRWDEFIGISIAEGIECDVIGVNPQYRSCIMKYWTSYVRRQLDKQTDIDTQTDRQTDRQENIVVPMVNND